MGNISFGFFVEEDKYYCWYCNEVKNINEFVKDGDNSKGFKSKCKECYNEYMREYRKLNKEKLRKLYEERRDRGYYKEYMEKNKDRIKEYRNKWIEKKKIEDNNK